MIRRPPRSTQGVSSAASDVYKRQGYRFKDGGDLDVHSRFHGPSHGPHEIMDLNEQCSDKLREVNKERLAKIEELKIAIEAAEELAQMIDMFTINTCAQTFEEKA